MASKDSFLDLQNEQGILIDEVNKIKTFRESAEQLQVDLHYNFKKMQHDLQESVHAHEETL